MYLKLNFSNKGNAKKIDVYELARILESEVSFFRIHDSIR